MTLGARIEGLGSETIEIVGVDRLAGGAHRVIPDRIEAATLLVAAAMTQGSVAVEGARRDHLAAVLEALHASGCRIDTDEQRVSIHGPQRLRALSLVARPYPGIPTDVQAQFMALASLAEGQSTICDQVFPERFMHVAELNRLGARIERQGNMSTVRGVRQLSGASVMASDLRASAALVLAALAADRQTIVRRVYHLDRGYERLDRKLTTLGARIARQPDHESPLAMDPAVIAPLAR